MITSSDAMTLEAAKSVGGQRITKGGESFLFFGFLSKQMRTAEENAAVQAWLESLEEPDFDVPEIKGDRVCLWDYERASNGGACMPRNWQTTGSCVHGGGETGLAIRGSLESLFGLIPETGEHPWAWLAYASARARGGSSGEGEGAVASYFAEELGNVGFGPWDTPGVPQPEILSADGSPYNEKVYTFSPKQEYFLSSIRNYKQEWKDACKPHQVGMNWVKTLDDAEKHLRRGRPLTWAGDWGGLMKCPVENGLLMNKHADSWMHQETGNGFIILGGKRYWNINNQWFSRSGAGRCVSVHGVCPFGSPPGSYWITDKDMEYQIKGGEVVALANVRGILRDIDWTKGA